MNNFRTDTDADGFMTVTFDAPGKSVNTFTPEAMDELAALVESLHALEQNERPVAVIFASGKPDAFIAGADLFAMREMNADQMSSFLRKGQATFDRIAALPMPTVAEINGSAMGGGCELALACTRRVMVDHGEASIGLPEIKLGIIPAWGGTTRLTRMFGLAKALPFLLAGKTVPPRKAKSFGLVDDVVRPEALHDAARRLARSKQPRPRPGLIDRAAKLLPPLRNMIERKARAEAAKVSFGNYPAPDKLIDAAVIALRDGHAAGLTAEREAVVALASGPVCRNLLRIFFLRQEAKKVAKQKLHAQAMPVKHVAVIGGGTMGAGIVGQLVKAGMHVRLVDISADAISAALVRIHADFADLVKAKRMTPLEAEQAMHRVSPTTDWSGLKLVDFVIEAVSERTEIKRDVFAKLDELTRDDCVLASNTSSLDITAFARSTRHPSRMIGLHFFNPVSKMPLVEVIAAADSSDTALATGLDLAMKIGKTPVLVNDAPGFLVNRVLFPYLAEAMVMAGEGVPIPLIDDAMKTWGMPMGPFELLDTVGLDVSVDIFRSVSARVGDHVPLPAGLEAVVPRGWLGHKSGIGFYDYKAKRTRGTPMPVNAELVASMRSANSNTRNASLPDANADTGAIAWRCVLPMVNEAARLLHEGVTDSTDTIDLATVMGLGLAPFRGGLCRFADETGLATIVTKMDDLAATHGNRFAPTPELRDTARGNHPMQMIADHRQSKP
jgi:3-hydroxyacyl-CoA dehydrogenase/enoyl-CoA hydratase/3-hydroxybutyryl-CoA epimerase